MFYEQKGTLMQRKLKCNWTPEERDIQERVDKLIKYASSLGIVFRLNVDTLAWEATVLRPE